MTDTIPRQAVIDAIEANAALDDFPDCEEYTQGLRDGKERALAAINALADAEQMTGPLSRYQKGYNSGVEEAAKALEADASLASKRAIEIIRALIIPLEQPSPHLSGDLPTL